MSALVKEARSLLRDAQPEASTDEQPTYYSDSDAIAAAQVIATLELAEQQRLANIIALAALEMNGPLRYLATQPLGKYDVGPSDEMTEGLGL